MSLVTMSLLQAAAVMMVWWGRSCLLSVDGCEQTRVIMPLTVTLTLYHMIRVFTACSGLWFRHYG